MNKPHRIARLSACTLIVIALALAALPLQSWAALDAYMRITGDVQGEIQGDVIQVGRENSILVQGYGYNLSADYDQVTGLPSGERQHRPVRVLKPVDKSSARLMHALITGENLSSVIIRFYRPTGAGAEENHLTVELVNARIVGITPTHSSTSAEVTTPFYETVSFTFQTIIQTSIDGSVATDTWQLPAP